MNKLNTYGCSFTKNLLQIEEIFHPHFNYTNYGEDSASNFFIFNRFRDTAEQNSTCIIQWSSLTRPNDDNFSIVKNSDNPLFDLLEQWYIILKEVQRISKNRNIKLIQFVGWAVWKDSELNDYHRDKLKSFDIIWLESSPQWDLITSNCFQFQQPNHWSSNENEQGLYHWERLQWGGMSEWIRENVDINNRYTYIPEHQRNGGPEIDPHPSPFAMKEFYEKLILPKIL